MWKLSGTRAGKLAMDCKPCVVSTHWAIGSGLRSASCCDRCKEFIWIGVVSVGDMHEPSRQPALAPFGTVLPVPSDPYQSHTCKIGNLPRDETGWSALWSTIYVMLVAPQSLRFLLIALTADD